MEPTDEIRERMEAALRNFVEGRIVRSSSLPTADLSIRKLTAVEALSRNRKADVKLLSSISIDPNLWPTSAVIDWLNILQNMADIPKRESVGGRPNRSSGPASIFRGQNWGFQRKALIIYGGSWFQTTSMPSG